AKSLRRFRGDASKVNVRGPGLKKARCNQTQTFTIDVKDAGHAMLCVGMVAPNGLPEPELMVKKNNPTQYTVSYKVVEAGEHTLCIRFGDEEVPGSPFSIAT
uniref:Filamin-C n=3 Tax=Magallana gigas TaxID=29159 RepID=A0A8W8J420_MAGGI